MLDTLPYGPAPEYKININPMFENSLRMAIDLFNEKRTEALNTLYSSEAITKGRTMDAAADVEEIAASCGYFSYNLTFFAEEMKVFLEHLKQLQCLQESGQRSWSWLKFWKKMGKKETKRYHEEGM